MTRKRQPQYHTGQQIVSGLVAGRGSRGCEPLVSLCKTTIECRRARMGDHSAIPQPTPFSSRTSSSYFDIESFPTSSLSSFKSRTQFEQLFDIFPDSETTPLPNFLTRFSLEEHTSLLAESTCLSTASTTLDIPISLPKHDTTCSYAAPPTLVMNLRKYASTESDDSAAVQPRSLASRLLHFGRSLSDHGSSGHSSEHGSVHGSDDEHHRQDDASSDSSPQSDDPQSATGSKYLLTPSALAVSTAHQNHVDDAEATQGTSSDASLASEADTTRATHEAMNTPITIPHSSAAPVAHGHHRPPIQLLGRNDDTPKVMTSTIANELRSLLPVHQRLAKSWRLVYSMDQHGISFNTMLALCAREGAMLLTVKDTKGKVFGAFLNESLRLSPTFYGQGSCFLWKAYKSSPQSRKKDAVKSFKYTGENEYFVLCDPDFVAIGGGRGLDPNHPKNTEADAQQEFVVGHFEIWAFNA